MHLDKLGLFNQWKILECNGHGPLVSCVKWALYIEGPVCLERERAWQCQLREKESLEKGREHHSLLNQLYRLMNKWTYEPNECLGTWTAHVLVLGWRQNVGENVKLLLITSTAQQNTRTWWSGVIAYECTSRSSQCPGRFLDIIGGDPSVSKSNWLHDHIFRVFLYWFEVCSLTSPKTINSFFEVLNVDS